MIQMDGGDRLRATFLDGGISTVERRQSLTLEAVLRADKQPPPSTSSPSPPPSSPPRNHPDRTLDIMRGEHFRGRGHGRDKTAWKSLREKLRLKRTATVWTSLNPNPTLDTPIPVNDRQNGLNRVGFILSSNSEGQSSHSQNDQTNHRQSNADVSFPSSSNGGGPAVAAGREGRIRLGVALAEERALWGRETLDPQSDSQPPRMSLMELLEENIEAQMGDSISGIHNVDDGGEEVVEEDRDGGAKAVAASSASCCVCMVRRKGAAFIPCGHTFCRLCSRELWVQRGNCPLCNATISEILDIF